MSGSQLPIDASSRGVDRHEPGSGSPEEATRSSSMTVRRLQDTVDRWITTYGVRYFSELTNLAVLMEEVGELARLMARTYGDQSFKADREPTGLGDELADVLFVLICIANQTGIDLETAIEKNLKKKTLRDHDRHRTNPKLTKS